MSHELRQQPFTPGLRRIVAGLLSAGGGLTRGTELVVINGEVDRGCVVNIGHSMVVVGSTLCKFKRI